MTRTKRYVMTVNKENLLDRSALDCLRRMVKTLNKHIDRKYYVKCHGRFGKKNPNLNNYRHKPGGRVNWSECRLDDAVRWDVYIYER